MPWLAQESRWPLPALLSTDALPYWDAQFESRGRSPIATRASQLHLRLLRELRNAQLAVEVSRRDLEAVGVQGEAAGGLGEGEDVEGLFFGFVPEDELAFAAAKAADEEALRMKIAGPRCARSGCRR